MSNDGSKFDPRFDPAYQPGYDGAREAFEPRLPTGGRPVAADRPVASPEIEFDAAVTTLIAPASAGPPAPYSEPILQAVGDPETELEEAALPSRNRYLIALGALAVALLVSGIVLIGFVRTIFDNRTEDLDYVTVQLLLVSGPIAIGLSIAIGAAFLIILALQSRD